MSDEYLLCHKGHQVAQSCQAQAREQEVGCRICTTLKRREDWLCRRHLSAGASANMVRLGDRAWPELELWSGLSSCVRGLIEDRMKKVECQ